MSESAYDPNAPEGDVGRGGQYISRKDIKVFAISFIVLAAILWPIYSLGVRNSEKARCSSNMGAIYAALGLYATDHDDRLPPVYRTSGADETPGLGETSGRPWTFVSDIALHMSERANFVCPSTVAAELVPNEHPQSATKSIPSSYGMYKPYDTALRSTIPDPGQTIILAETSNGGAKGSFDPLAFKYDGFVIGWDNSNQFPNGQTKAVTRLAFREVSNGTFKEDSLSRHDAGIHAITANGRLLILKPQDSQVTIQKSTGLPIGFWNFPP